MTLRPRILDAYLVRELAGPFTFGLSAFTLLIAATTILAISKLVAQEHAPLSAAIEYFIFQLPGIVVLVIPLALLLGTLLTLQRLSGESEITAMKAGGIGLVRIVVPLLAVGFVASLVTIALQEGLVPIANDRATFLREDVIKRVGTLVTASNTVTTTLPDGGRQITYFTGYDRAARALLHVTLIKYDAASKPQLIVFTDRARFGTLTWTFEGASEYRFSPDGTTTYFSYEPVQEIDIGEKPTQIERRVQSDNPDDMSRGQLRDIMNSGQLSPAQLRTYQVSYAEKLARPFGAFVFTLIAIPFGLRPARGGGGTGAGFGVAVLFGFVYFVLASVASAVGSTLQGGPAVATLAAWTPNIIFTAIGAALLRRSAAA